MITIRIASIDEAELIADLSRKTFYDSFAGYNTKEDIDKFMNEQFTKDALMKEVSTENNIFLLAYNGNMPVGYVRLRENNIPPSRNQSCHRNCKNIRRPGFNRERNWNSHDA